MELVFFVLVTGLTIFIIWWNIKEHRAMKRHQRMVVDMHRQSAENWIRSLPRFEDYRAEALLRETLRKSWEEKNHDWKKEGF